LQDIAVTKTRPYFMNVGKYFHSGLHDLAGIFRKI
jgi:hypothetical protein